MLHACMHVMRCAAHSWRCGCGRAPLHKWHETGWNNHASLLPTCFIICDDQHASVYRNDSSWWSYWTSVVQCSCARLSRFSSQTVSVCYSTMTALLLQFYGKCTLLWWHGYYSDSTPTSPNVCWCLCVGLPHLNMTDDATFDTQWTVDQLHDLRHIDWGAE